MSVAEFGSGWNVSLYGVGDKSGQRLSEMLYPTPYEELGTNILASGDTLVLTAGAAGPPGSELVFTNGQVIIYRLLP